MYTARIKMVTDRYNTTTVLYYSPKTGQISGAC